MIKKNYFSGRTLHVDVNMHLKNMLLKTIFDKKSRILVHPFGITIETFIQLYNEADANINKPRSVLTMTTDLVSVLIGQEHIMCFNKVVEEVHALMPVSFILNYFSID